MLTLRAKELSTLLLLLHLTSIANNLRTNHSPPTPHPSVPWSKNRSSSRPRFDSSHHLIERLAFCTIFVEEVFPNQLIEGTLGPRKSKTIAEAKQVLGNARIAMSIDDLEGTYLPTHLVAQEWSRSLALCTDLHRSSV